MQNKDLLERINLEYIIGRKSPEASIEPPVKDHQ